MYNDQDISIKSNHHTFLTILKAQIKQFKLNFRELILKFTVKEA